MLLTAALTDGMPVEYASGPVDRRHLMGALTVARKKTPKTPKPTPGPEEWTKKPLILNLRGSEEFKTWIQGLATFDRQSVSGLVERALVHYGRAIGYKPEAPER
jgi:hypothetical protein